LNQLPFNITTILNTEEFRFKEKGSLFLSQIFQIKSTENAIEIIKETKKKFFDATHNCYAFRLANGETKYSDDGEPNGTAGLRILNAIKHENLFNVLIIVTRYFGGTKLGVGPLGQAYYNSAIQVINKANKVSQELYIRLIINFPFEFANLVHRTIAKFSVKIEDTTFDDHTVITCLVPANRIINFEEELKSSSLFNVHTQATDTHLYI